MSKKRISKFLIPLDGSPTSLRGLKFGIVLAKQAEASIIGLTVNKIPLYMKSSIPNSQKLQRKKIIDQAKKMSQKFSVPFVGTTKESENIGKTIVSFAEKKGIDMIIIGSRGPDPEGGLYLGSVANYIIHKSKIPVTVVK